MRIKRYQFYILFAYFLPFISGLYSQGTMLSARDNDPKAKSILDKLKKQYDSYKTMEVSFEMELELPGKKTELRKGIVIQDGKMYQIKMEDQEIYSDTKTVWVYLKNNNEVQISDYEESESSDVMSPKQMMSLYEKGDFIYSLIEERKVGKNVFADIEFKPVSKKSDFTKMRLTVDKNSNKMISLRVFSRDGSKYLLKISDLKSNKKYDPAIFSFNPKAVTGVHIEDLRMD
ncbi:MAG: outer membrane lipoprotein carrier protein LolA [Saprospiraceae bacterium]|jgi:outer membrane lipoprotein-sorting protein|nr:outer membrane lipoprotein carrier protein LolA [Saprospiraceae bacterium]